MERSHGREPSESDAAGGVARLMPQGSPALRVAVGLGDSERERDLLPALVETGEMVAVQRCLSADHLLECVRRERTDACLVAEGLHRLTFGALVDLARARMPLVLLTSTPDEPRWQGASGLILPLNADPTTVRQALLAAVRGERSVPFVQAPETGVGTPTTPTPEASLPSLSVLAVASGPGSPGRTTVALNLAAGLGMVAPTVLVDVDLSGPSVAAHLDADPTRNLYMLAHAEPEATAEWSHAVEQEIQPFGGQCVHGSVLCGAPKLELRAGVTARFVERLIQELRRRYRYVILDVGAELLGRESAPHRAAIQAADHVLLVASADMVGLWHARTGLGLLRGQLGIDQERIALIINRHDRRFHHGQFEIEWALGLPASAVIPNDQVALQRALSAQRPLILSGRGAAARSLLDLAERVHGGAIRLPPQMARRGKLDLLRRVLPIRLTRRPGLGGHITSGRLDDEHDTRDTARTAASRPRSGR
jgi:MinD-like ATPase involved in chromosome partitioning or flagellar assembly